MNIYGEESDISDWLEAVNSPPETPAETPIIYATSTPNIDGAIDSQWLSASNQTISRVVVGSGTSPDDLSAAWRAMWNTTHLFLLVDVNDQSLQNNSGSTWWEDDVVELFLDLGNEKASTYDGNDYQLAFRWNDSTVHVGTNSPATDAGQINFQMVSTGDGYLLEAAIPWNILNTPQGVPSQDAIIGFDVSIDDDDGAGRETQITWHAETEYSFQNPSIFGTAQFTGSPPADSDITFATAAPTIDGALDAPWSTTSSYVIDNVVVGSVSSPTDFSATWRGLWDNTNLYLLVDVNDQSLQNNSGSIWWEDDVVELFLDLGNEKAAAYDGNDYQLAFRWNDGAVHVGTNSPATDTGPINFQMVATGDGYLLEAAIPWSIFNTPANVPSENVIIGFDIGIDDDDGSGRESQAMWYATTEFAFQNPSLFGTARMIDAPGATEAPPVIQPTSDITMETALVNSSVADHATSPDFKHAWLYRPETRPLVKFAQHRRSLLLQDWNRFADQRLTALQTSHVLLYDRDAEVVDLLTL